MSKPADPQQFTCSLPSCGKVNVANRSQRKSIREGLPVYCDRTCANLGKSKPKVQAPCDRDGCGNTVERDQHRMTGTSRVFCSTTCRNLAGMKPRTGKWFDCGNPTCSERRYVPKARYEANPDAIRYCSNSCRASRPASRPDNPAIERARQNGATKVVFVCAHDECENTTERYTSAVVKSGQVRAFCDDHAGLGKRSGRPRLGKTFTCANECGETVYIPQYRLVDGADEFCCSRTCKGELLTKQGTATVTCDTCGTPFRRQKSRLGEERNYCTKACGYRGATIYARGHVNKDGYRIVPDPAKPGTGIGEHRIIMAALLGRRLRPDEQVHHRGQDKASNRVDGPLRPDPQSGRLYSGDLELWSHEQPAGQDVLSKVESGVDWLDRYWDYVTPETVARLRALLERPQEPVHGPEHAAEIAAAADLSSDADETRQRAMRTILALLDGDVEAKA